MMFRKVVLPHPLVPAMASSAPASRENEGTSRTVWASPSGLE